MDGEDGEQSDSLSDSDSVEESDLVQHVNNELAGDLKLTEEGEFV